MIKSFLNIPVLLGILLLTACGNDDDNGKTIILYEEQEYTDNAPKILYEEQEYTDNTPQVIKDTAEKFILKELDKHEYSMAEFDSESSVSTLIVIKYGELRDCPSGCFSSHICAITEDNETKVYSAIWYDSNEIPNELHESCLSESGNTIHDCNVPPSGFNLPVTSTLEFQVLLEKEGSAFRYCL